MNTDEMEYRELNDPAKVIALLRENRTTVMEKLNKYFQYIDFHDNQLYKSYKSILPAIWGVIKTSDEDHLNYSKEVLKKLIEHNAWSAEKKHLVDWCMFFEGRSNSRKIHHNAKGLLGYENLQFFTLLCKWLKYHKLHKYAYFFANLTFEEFQIIDENSIKELEKKINMPAITEGGRGTILRHMKNLKTRISDLSNTLEDVNRNKWMLLIKTMLHTPIHVCEDSKLITLLKEAIIAVYGAVHNNSDLQEELYLIRLLNSARSCYFFSQHDRRIFSDLQESCELFVDNMTSKPIYSTNTKCNMNQLQYHVINLNFGKSSHEIPPHPFIPFKSLIHYSNTSNSVSSSSRDGSEKKHESYEDIISRRSSMTFNKISTAALPMPRTYDNIFTKDRKPTDNTFVKNVNNPSGNTNLRVNSFISSCTENRKLDKKIKDASASLVIEISKFDNKGTATFQITPNTVSKVTDNSIRPHVVKTWLSNWEFNAPSNRHVINDIKEDEDIKLMNNMLKIEVYLNSLLSDVE